MVFSRETILRPRFSRKIWDIPEREELAFIFLGNKQGLRGGGVCLHDWEFGNERRGKRRREGYILFIFLLLLLFINWLLLSVFFWGKGKNPCVMEGREELVATGKWWWCNSSSHFYDKTVPGLGYSLGLPFMLILTSKLKHTHTHTLNISYQIKFISKKKFISNTCNCLKSSFIHIL